LFSRKSIGGGSRRQVSDVIDAADVRRRRGDRGTCAAHIKNGDGHLARGLERALPRGVRPERGIVPRQAHRRPDREVLITTAPRIVDPGPGCPRKRQLTGRLPELQADRVEMRGLSG
jgi:hypothetical protein